MKVIQRGIMKIVPGRMAEAMKLFEEWKTHLSRLEAPIQSMKILRRLSGRGDIMQTIIFEAEWGSFSEMASFFDKGFTDPEFQAHQKKWDSIIESHEMEVLTPLPEQG